MTEPINGTLNQQQHIVIVGAGFTGLSAAYALAKKGIKVTVLEKDARVGGLAQCFDLGDTQLERFYHHWFTNDQHIMSLVEELGVTDQVTTRPSRTGMYYANQQYRLASPLDVLRFKPLSVLDRVRLGIMVLVAQRCYKNWQALDDISAADWLTRLGGRRVFETIWEPLLIGKFGKYAHEVSAAWFWSKLVLRGGSRGKQGHEMLAYYKGSFAALAEEMVRHITRLGGQVLCNTGVNGLIVEQGQVRGVVADTGTIACDGVIATPALPVIADWVSDHVPAAYTIRLREVKYLANVCLVLQLKRSLSEIYWMNVNDPSFPFVGIIEHTNFEPASTYQQSHIVYLSKYLPVDEPMYAMDADGLLEFALPHIRKMFPDFSRELILNHYLWRTPFGQPVVTTGYRHLIPDYKTPIGGFYIATMAQIYPEDRGTNYAIREGKKVAQMLMSQLPQSSVPCEAPL